MYLRRLISINRSDLENAQVDEWFKYRYLQILTNDAADYCSLHEG